MIRHCAFSKSLLPAVLLTSYFAGSPLAYAMAIQSAAQQAAEVPGGARIPGQTTAKITVDLEHPDQVKTLHIAVGRSLVLSTKTPLKRIYVGNPLVLQSFNSGPQEVVLTAKAYGLSNLVLWDTAGHSQMYSFSADMDCEEVRTAFENTYPGVAIDVETREGKLFLSGDVPSDAVSDSAVKMATAYSKDVVNGLRVVPPHGKQVELKLRIVEVDRQKAEQFGINFARAAGNAVSSLSTQQFPSSVTEAAGVVTASDPLNLFLYSFNLHAGVTIKDLESKNILQVLAEPTLTTMSGLPARFLSGGEFPVPVVQGGTGNSTAITVVYRPYGVKVDFTPTVNKDGTIRLKVSPEVSTLDYTNSVTLSGTTVPALSTRRAETEVEIRDGESFMVSGLLDHRVTDVLSSVPGISNIPIIGQLFRSKSLSRSVVELVVLVTATVVDPLKNGSHPSEPRMAVPNMDSNGFDQEFRPLIKPGSMDIPLAPTPPAPVAKAPTAEAQRAAAEVLGKGEGSLVQIAAVVQQQEADQVVDSLKHKGYTAAVLHEPQDKLLHVQIGPYAERDDAEALRQRLVNDGFRAVVMSRTNWTETR